MLVMYFNCSDFFYILEEIFYNEVFKVLLINLKVIIRIFVVFLLMLVISN